MATYFDRREQREKPIPECWRVGCVWDEQTQRCERPDYMMLFEEYNQTPDYYSYEYEAEYDGMGFLPGPAIAVAAGAGPVGWIVAGVATAASFIGKLFGFGGDDQATSYRPPPNAQDYFIQYDDKYGQEYVSYDMGPQTQQITAARGNRWDDVSSYYSMFISGNTSSGASSAAARVVQDVARQHGVSISRAADLVLQAAGAIRIVQSFKPGPGMQQGSQGQTPSGLPGYCPPGEYHPYPIGHPDQNLCVPFPTDIFGTGTGQTQPKPVGSQTGSKAGAGAKPGQMTSALPGSGTGAGTQGQTQTQGQGQSLTDLLGKMPWPIWLILLLVAGAMMTGDSKGETTTTITRRKK